MTVNVIKPPLNRLDLAPPDVELDRRPDGTILMRSPLALPESPRATGVYLEQWAQRTPEAVFLAERPSGDGGWREISYAATLGHTRALAQALIDRRLGPESPVMFLSDNSISQALLTMAGHHAGVPVVPVSPAYSLLSEDFGKLRRIVDLTNPGMVFAEQGGPFARALTTVDFGNAEAVVASDVPTSATRFEALLNTAPTQAVDDAFAAMGPDSIAKILFTSGSTGTPKGVINTQRMMTANQEQILALWPFLADAPPVIVDWLPWSHTFGGNHDFNMVLRNGGCLYIDTGKPAPGRFEPSLRNLGDIAPTLYFNVPRGFEMLIPHLESDDGFRDHFFSRLDAMMYAGASLPPNLWNRLEDLSVAARGERVRIFSAWGTTETAPMATRVHYDIDRAGLIGLPAPACEIKLIPHAGSLEVRARGPNITPGYWRRDDLTAAAFDEEGFYIAGDAVRFADPDKPAKGLAFDGRIAEDFKLTTGTWVHVGHLRLQAISAADPIIQDCVVTGHDRDFVGLLVFPDLAACRALCPDLGPEAPAKVILADSRIRDRLRTGLTAHNQANPASSTRLCRAMLMAEPAGIDRGEITDKGYINQRAVLTARADLVDRLHGGEDAGVIVID